MWLHSSYKSPWLTQSCGGRDATAVDASAGDRLLFSEGQVSEQAQEFLLCHICHPAGEALQQQHQGTLAYTMQDVGQAFQCTTCLQGNIRHLARPNTSLRIYIPRFVQLLQQGLPAVVMHT